MIWTNEDTYQRAAEIADQLLASGVPLVSFGGSRGGITMVFQLEDEQAKYAARLSFIEASPERFRELYEAMR